MTDKAAETPEPVVIAVTDLEGGGYDALIAHDGKLTTVTAWPNMLNRTRLTYTCERNCHRRQRDACTHILALFSHLHTEAITRKETP